jgi:hypothetical protein
MGPIKFGVTFLVGPPNCTSSHVVDLKVDVYKIKDMVAYKNHKRYTRVACDRK